MSPARGPMDELDYAIFREAAALREHVAAAAETGDVWEQFEAARAGVVALPKPGGDGHRRWVVVAAAGMVAAMLVTLVLVQVVRDDVPTQRPVATTPTLPAPTVVVAPTSVPVVTSTIPATTSTVAAQPEATTSLATIGPDQQDFLPYPPDVVALADGRVLKIVLAFDSPIATYLEVLDPATGEVVVAGDPLVTRSNPAMVVLQDGRVLIAGGDNADNTIADASTGEVFDPRTGQSISAGPMVAPRWSPRAGLLQDGRVLVVGTVDNPPNTPATAVAELYDPATNSFTATGLRTSTSPVTDVFPLFDGRLLVLGQQPEIYDPATGTFAATPGRTNITPDVAVMLADGTVLAIDGYCPEVSRLDTDGLSEGHAPAKTERFDPIAGSFTPGPSIPHCVQTATLLPSGEVFVTGYWPEVAWSGVLDPTSGITRITPNPNRRSPKAVIVDDGRVLLVAGVPLGERGPNADTLPWADVFP